MSDSLIEANGPAQPTPALDTMMSSPPSASLALADGPPGQPRSRTLFWILTPPVSAATCFSATTSRPATATCTP